MVGGIAIRSYHTSTARHAFCEKPKNGIPFLWRTGGASDSSNGVPIVLAPSKLDTRVFTFFISCTPEPTLNQNTRNYNRFNHFLNLLIFLWRWYNIHKSLASLAHSTTLHVSSFYPSTSSTASSPCWFFTPERYNLSISWSQKKTCTSRQTREIKLPARGRMDIIP